MNHYNPSAAPSTYEHRSGECDMHGGNAVVYRVKNRGGSYRCVECELDAMRAVLARLYELAADDAIADFALAPVLRLVSHAEEVQELARICISESGTVSVS